MGAITVELPKMSALIREAVDAGCTQTRNTYTTDEEKFMAGEPCPVCGLGAAAWSARRRGLIAESVPRTVYLVEILTGYRLAIGSLGLHVTGMNDDEGKSLTEIAHLLESVGL
jgi:hypothetical protein